MTTIPEASKIEVLPLTPERWPDLERLFGPNGCYGCWCMWYRLNNTEFKQAGKEGRREGLQALVQAGADPGLIAYVEGKPAGWVTIASREQYARLRTSRSRAAVDDAPVWSIPCFFVHRSYRRQGLMEVLIRAAVEYARSKGAAIIEAYPYDGQEKRDSASLFMGVGSVFRKLGFKEVARRVPDSPVMRLDLL